jgi:mercuric ion binding protein
MKTIKRICVLALALGITSYAKAQNYNYKLDGPFTATKTFKVNGVCEMCKQWVENAIKKLPGIWNSNWDVNAKTLLVRYDRIKVNPDRMEQLIAAAGQDKEMIKAPDLAYRGLPACCLYERNL